MKASKRFVADIKENPLNKQVYFDCAIDDLVLSIKEVGLLEPLLIDQDNLLISGHRRLKALKQLGIKKCKVIVKEYENERDRQRDFLDSNSQRNKSTLDRMKEAELDTILTKERRGNPSISQNSDELGRTDDYIAKKYGLGSRDTWRKLQVIREELGNEAILELDDEKKNVTVNKLFKRIENEKRQQKRREEIEKANDTYLPEGVRLINDDFRKSDIKENSIDCIITDPPYPGEFLPLWKDLSIFANKVLKPSGFLVAYSGEIHLDETIQLLKTNLNYYWAFALKHIGKTQLINARNIMCAWKPILVFQKEPFKKLEFTAYDYVESKKDEKELHDWQQSESGAEKLIEIFSQIGDIVLDPFSGAGTIPYVAYKMKRKTIGIEIDKDSYLLSKSRIGDNKKI